MLDSSWHDDSRDFGVPGPAPARGRQARRGSNSRDPEARRRHRIFVIDCAEEDEPSELLVFINPEIFEKDGQIVWNEGCLSFPGVREEIKRAERVKVRALDRSGKPFELEAEGLLAVAIQHETDHLNGVLMVDKLNALKRRMMGRRLAQARKEAESSPE